MTTVFRCPSLSSDSLKLLENFPFIPDDGQFPFDANRKSVTDTTDKQNLLGLNSNELKESRRAELFAKDVVIQR